MTIRMTARRTLLAPSRALRAPVRARASRTATKVTGTRRPAGGSRMASIGSRAPDINETAEAPAAWTGLGTSAGSMCSSASRWAARAPWAESSSATVRAVAGERPLASYSAVSSVNSVSGESASSRSSCAICARSLSRWLETDAYSPSAIDTAPPTRPASPAVKMGPRSGGGPRNPDDNGGDRHDSVVGAQHPGPQPVQATRAGTRMRLRAVSRPPALGRLNLSHRWHCVVNPLHPSSGRPTVTHCSGSVGGPAP